MTSIPAFPLVLIVPVALLLAILLCIFIEFQQRKLNSERPSSIEGPIRKGITIGESNEISLDEYFDYPSFKSEQEKHKFYLHGKSYEIKLNPLNGLQGRWIQIHV